MNALVWGIFTWQRMLFFIAGILTSWAWNLYVAKREGNRPVNSNYIGIIAGVSIMMFLVMSQVNQSHEIGKCQHEFVTAIDARATLSARNDDLSEQQRRLLLQDNIALGDWINSLLNPPVPRESHPAYDDWAIGVTQQYYGRTSVIREQLAKVQAEVDNTKEQREKHPLPEPACKGS